LLEYELEQMHEKTLLDFMGKYENEMPKIFVEELMD
jgi:hypothetical protein